MYGHRPDNPNPNAQLLIFQSPHLGQKGQVTCQMKLYAKFIDISTLHTWCSALKCINSTPLGELNPESFKHSLDSMIKHHALMVPPGQRWWQVLQNSLIIKVKFLHVSFICSQKVTNVGRWDMPIHSPPNQQLKTSFNLTVRFAERQI